MTDLRSPTIYFAQAGAGAVKIGWTSQPRRRYARMQGDNAQHVRILASVPGSSKLAEQVRQRFKALRIRGQWFHPGPELLQFAEDAESEKVRMLLDASLRDVG